MVRHGRDARLEKRHSHGVLRGARVPRVSNVRSERGNRTLSIRVGLVLRHNPEEREHGDATVGNLLALQRFEILPLGESRRVKLTARVHALLRRSRTALRFGKRHEQRVNTDNGKQRRVGFVTEVFRRAFPRVRLRAHPVAVSGDFDGDDAGDAEHGPPRVLELSLAVTREVFRLFTQLERVKAVITIIGWLVGSTNDVSLAFLLALGKQIHARSSGVPQDFILFTHR